jgi:transcription termination factor Rho
MSVLDPRELQASPLADLHALASELGIEGFRRLRKEELIEQIIAVQGGTPAPEAIPT